MPKKVGLINEIRDVLKILTKDGKEKLRFKAADLHSQLNDTSSNTVSIEQVRGTLCWLDRIGEIQKVDKDGRELIYGNYVPVRSVSNKLTSKNNGHSGIVDEIKVLQKKAEVFDTILPMLKRISGMIQTL